MTTLHLINNPSNALQSCLRIARIAKKDSVILLIEDAVIAVTKNSAISEQIKNYLVDNKVYVLEPDLKARGIRRIIEGVEKVDYDGFVKLTVEYNGVQSWT
jgi:tRNA 2-thiouridine synthesizing protein B